ncbi:zinc-binding dehydrogenase [candidate division GN15 bacterium]|nr:zinc-binding dehydrogenase [candidate division GN15 bacterium]
MKTVVYVRYGGPEVLEFKEVAKPTPKGNEVLVKIHASTVTTTETYFRKGKPLMTRLFTGLLRPKLGTLGEELAGEIVDVGSDVSRFNIGDQVFGTAGPKFGANAEYLCIPEGGVLAPMPARCSYEEAAASVDGFLTALPFLRDTGGVQRGQQVLINGASGSIGSSAVQVAKHLGASVSAVCSTANVELVKSLGAERVFDYTREDFTWADQRYDVIFDAVGKLSFSRCKDKLREGGIFLEAAIVPSVMITVLRTSLFGSRKVKVAATGMRKPVERLRDLELLRQLLESGGIRPVIDRRYSLDQIVEAHRYVDQGHKKGNVVIKVASESD